MEDHQILALYRARSDTAVAETEKKYGTLCRTAVSRVLSDARDREECVNDTWLALWNRIPPESPRSLPAYLCRIARRIALNRLKFNGRQKRSAELVPFLEELDACLPDGAFPDTEEDLTALLNDFLRGADPENRRLFLLRYLYLKTPSEIARETSLSENAVVTRLYRVRQKLKRFLKERNYSL